MNSPEAVRRRLVKYLLPVVIFSIAFNIPKFMEARVCWRLNPKLVKSANLTKQLLEYISTQKQEGLHLSATGTAVNVVGDSDMKNASETFFPACPSSFDKETTNSLMRYDELMDIDIWHASVSNNMISDYIIIIIYDHYS